MWDLKDGAVGWTLWFILGVDSLSILFNPRSFQTPIAVSQGFGMPGKNGEGTPRFIGLFL